ncbi:MAG: enoyl-CoA hydratase [Gammaproteobacteria bacterium]|nr:enoyl-CoA hydratase [Gammaproteobacteria bacterium]
MSEEVVLEKLENGVMTLTLNRPESLNALSQEMMDALLEKLPAAAANSEVGALVLTGAGRGFCAGGDVKNMASRNAGGSGSGPSMEDRARSLRESMEISRFLHELPMPVIAMIKGPAAGAGLAMALACDIRIAAESAVFTTAFARVGFSGDFGGSYFLTKILGTAKARELYYTAARVNATQALELGMVNHVVSEENLDNFTLEMAQNIANGPRVAHHYMKKNLNAAEWGTLEQVFDMEAWHMTRTGMTEDHREAARAFVEKRDPVFKGR